MVVVAENGALLAAGGDTTPAWIYDSGGVETWAFFQVIREQQRCVRLHTDYLGICTALRRGQQWATAAECLMARLWTLIYAVLDSPEEVGLFAKHTT